MAYSLTFSDQQDWLLVVAEGDVTGFPEYAEKAQRVVESVLETGVKRVFLDDRRLVLSVDAHDITLLAEKLGEANLQSIGLRLACLCKPECNELYRTIETIYQNRSLNFRIFCDKDEALEWLLT